MLILFALMLLFFCRKALKFEAVGRWEYVFVPTYALIMFLVTFTWRLSDGMILGVLTLLSTVVVFLSA